MNVAEEYAKQQKIYSDCLAHEENYGIYLSFGKPYRRYRRGKNRCKRCGLKVEYED